MATSILQLARRSHCMRHSSMKEHQPITLDEFSFPPNVGANRAGPLRSSPLVLLLTLLVSALATAAQTGGLRVAEIHDPLGKAPEYLQAKDPNSAVKEFDAVLALDPKNAEAYANLGVVAFFRHDYRNASQYLRKAVAID